MIFICAGNRPGTTPHIILCVVHHCLLTFSISFCHSTSVVQYSDFILDTGNSTITRFLYQSISGQINSALEPTIQYLDLLMIYCSSNAAPPNKNLGNTTESMTVVNYANSVLLYQECSLTAHPNALDHR